MWDTERRYGQTRNPDSPRFSLFLNRTVFTPRKDPLRPPPFLAAYGSQEASGASPREQLSGQVCSRPPKAALLSPRKLVGPDLWPMRHAEPRATRLPSSPSSLHRSFRMEASVANEQRWASICHSCRSCQHTVPFWCNAHYYWGPAAKKRKDGPGKRALFRLGHS